MHRLVRTCRRIRERIESGQDVNARLGMGLAIGLVSLAELSFYSSLTWDEALAYGATVCLCPSASFETAEALYVGDSQNNTTMQPLEPERRIQRRLGH